MDAIEHTASPFHFNASDPKDLIDPAVKGTTGVLESIVKHAPHVKRVVVTSSVAAVWYSLPEPKVFSEEDWNEASVREVEQKGKSAPGGDIYRASKTLAEKAAWQFHAQHKDRVQWDLVVINPPIVCPLRSA
jgi:nucleoside-diphosphate-sugar epimerase